MEKIGIEYEETEEVGTVIHIAIENIYAGNIIIADEIKEDARKGIEILKKQSGIRKIIMLTGDLNNIAEKIGNNLSIDEIYYELLPENKVEKVEKIIKNTNNGTVIFVGDGINDAPVLARADIGIAMGGIGSDAAIEAADVIIMTDEISKIEKAIKISKKTLKIAKQNIVFAITVKVLVLILSVLGLSNMWQAVFADVGVTVIAIINALRNLNTKKMS